MTRRKKEFRNEFNNNTYRKIKSNKIKIKIFFPNNKYSKQIK